MNHETKLDLKSIALATLATLLIVAITISAIIFILWWFSLPENIILISVLAIVLLTVIGIIFYKFYEIM